MLPVSSDGISYSGRRMASFLNPPPWKIGGGLAASVAKQKLTSATLTSLPPVCGIPVDTCELCTSMENVAAAFFLTGNVWQVG